MRLRKPTAVRKNKSRILHHAIEFLEPRQLLTTVHGGDVFQYQDPAGNIDRVVLTGNITAELIGATVGPNNTVQLINLPGELNGVPVNGGLNGAAGTQLIGNITVTDPTVPAGSPQDNSAPAISALASNSSGATYGLVITPITSTTTVGTSTTTSTTNLVQVLQFADISSAPAASAAAATVLSEISGQLINDAGSNWVAGTGANAGPIQVTGITAAAINPTNGLLYFVATGGATNVPILFSVDVSSGNAATIGNSVTMYPGTFGSANGNVSAINAITFDSTGILYAVGKIPAGNNELFQVDTTDTDTITTPLPVMLGNAAVAQTITGIAFQGGGNTTLTAVTTGGAAAGDVLAINDTTGQAINYGSLASGTALGDNPGDLTFNPTLTDPFTGTTGALIATDTATHQLFYVDAQNRGGTSGATLYAIYVSQSDINASISVSQASSVNGADEPFTGSIDLDIPNANGTGTTTINGPADSGTVLLGAGIFDGNTTVSTGTTTSVNPTYTPFFSATVNQSFGVLPGSYSTLNAGLIVAPGQNVGNFLLGGTVIGNVNIQASMQTFYAGWVLTGDADGVTAGTITNPENFFVAGDLRNLLVAGPIGTEPGTLSDAVPSYLTGFDMVVDGTVGQIQTLNQGVTSTTGTTSTSSSGASPIVGSINVYNESTVTGLTSPQLQTEYDTTDAFGGFDQGELAGSSLVDNNTYYTPQYLGSIDSSDLNESNVAYVSGTLNASTGNGVDYYAVPLMAGQTITVQLKPSIAGELDVEAIDPNGVVVGSDFNEQDSTATGGQALTFTTQIPGVYRFAVTTFDNPTLDVAAGSAVGTVPYFLTINGIGDLALGAIVATGGFMDNVITNSGTPGVGVANGDLGGIIAGGNEAFPPGDATSSVKAEVSGGGAVLSNGNPQTFAVSNGNLRVITGTAIGGNDTLDPEIAVPNGSVGLVQSTINGIFFNHPTTTTPNVIGGNYQVVDANADLGADLLADGSIGDIRAGDIADPLNSEFKVGVGGAQGQSISLIESDGYTNSAGVVVPGDFGTLDTGGPAISVGMGGYVGYISVPGGTIYRDDAFGGSVDTPFTYSPGVSAQVVDSSGNLINITPSQPYITYTTSSTGSSSSTTTTTTAVTLAPAGALSLTLYGIEGSGGSAIVDVESTESMSITGQENNSDQGIYIGRIQVEGTGDPVVDYTPVAGSTAITSSITQPGVDGLPGLQLESGSNIVPLYLTLSGAAPLDVLDTIITTNDTATPGDATSITNSTTGEMANIVAGSIGTLSVNGPLGTTQNSSTGAAVLPRTTISSNGTLDAGPRPVMLSPSGEINVGDLYPFTNAKTGVEVEDGNILSISSNTSIGNVMVLGSIGRISAGTDGIVGAVAALDTADYAAPTIGGSSADDAGRILQVDVGGGIAAGGPGASVGNYDELQWVTPTPPPPAPPPNSGGAPGLYADSAIGNISGNAGANIYGDIVSKFSIGSITLGGGGSIVDSRIGDLTEFNFAQDVPQTVTVPTNGSTVDKPVIDLGPINISGNGGIIGSIFWGSDMGQVSVPDGFGVLNSTFLGVSSGYFAGIVAGGYGIRQVGIYDMTTIGTLNATGSGANVGTGNFSASVLSSDNGSTDTATGIGVNATNDLNAFLGTSASQPQIVGVTTTGLISDFISRGAFNLGSVKAYEITATQPTVNPDIFDFANSIGSIVTASQIVGAQIITGKLGTFEPGGDVVDSTLNISGTIKDIVLKANFTQGSSIIAAGNNGFIKKLVIDGNMDGTITANRKITTVNISGTFSGTIKAAQIGTVTMGQGLGTGTLSVDGPINKMVIDGNLATAGNSLVINDKINTLQVDGDLNADVTVAGNLGKLIVGGSITSGTTVTVGNVMNTLKVAGDVQAGSTVQAKRIKKVLVKGVIDGTIIGAPV